MTVDPNAVLMGGGVATAKFDTPGATHGGRIIAKPQAFQEREYIPGAPGTGKLKTFPSGDPIMSLTVDVQTNLRDPNIEDDDGLRRIYIQGKRMKTTVRDAVRAAGATGLEVGGELTITYTHSEDPTDKQSAKHYTATYVPAASAALMAADTPPTGTQQLGAAGVDPWQAQTRANSPAAYAPPAATPTTTAPAATPDAGAVDPAAIQAAMANLNPAILAAIQAQQAS